MKGCIYCGSKCACGGTKTKLKGKTPKSGEVRTRCSKCRTEWTHWHVAGRGRAKP